MKRYNNKIAAHSIMKLVEEMLDLGTINLINLCSTAEEVYKVLCTVPGISAFLGYQIFVDFTYMDEFPFSENEFTVAGPGCQKGLDSIFLDTDGMTPEECLFWLRDNLDWLFTERLGLEWSPEKLFQDLPKYDRYMNVMSLENCMCEFSKYMKVKHGLGRPRKTYKPQEGTK